MSSSAMRITVDRRDHVGHVRFTNPPLNFASVELLAGLADAIVALDADPEVRCILLSSEGRAFCAGADLQGGAAGEEGDRGVEAIGAFYAQAGRLLDRAKPMVAAIQGAAVGAGLGLALTADFRIASPAAKFAANFVQLGFHPGFGLTCTLPRAIGRQRAAWMMLSAERVRAEQAVGWGLVDRLAGEETLLDEAAAMAGAIAANAPLALVDVRRTMVGSLASDARAAMAFELSRQTLLRRTDDYAEAVAAVFERREARFVGR